MLLEGKKLLITGVLTDDSIAFAVAKVAQENGAEILLTNVGRGVRLTEKVARKLPTTPDVMQMDVNNPDDVAAVATEVMTRWSRVDGVLHGIAFAPAGCTGRQLHDCAVGECLRRVPDIGLLAQGSDRRHAGAAEGGRRRWWRIRGVADL